jgi:hypothetical protein
MAIESANGTKNAWNGGMDEETAQSAVREISGFKMAEAA